MAHASSMEKGKLQIKKLKKQRRKRELAWNSMSEEEREEIIRRRQEPPSIKTIVAHALYDLEHSQFPRTKYSYLLDKIAERKKEIEEEIEKLTHTQDIEPDSINIMIFRLREEQKLNEKAAEAVRNGNKFIKG